MPRDDMGKTCSLCFNGGGSQLRGRKDPKCFVKSLSSRWLSPAFRPHGANPPFSRLIRRTTQWFRLGAPSSLLVGALAFRNPSTLLITEGEGSSTIYAAPVTRAANGHVTGLGTPVVFASGASGLDAGLAFGPGGVLFARSYSSVLYEFKPGSTSPDSSVNLTTFDGYPGDFGTLQFVPPGFPGAGVLKAPDFRSRQLV